MNYKVLIVDDEQPARILLQEYVEKTPHLELLQSCSNALDALEILSTQAVDILLLDIQMSQLSGLDLLKTLEKHPATILTTAFSEFALEGFELDVVDYLLKPISFQRFIKAITKAKRLLGSTTVLPHEPSVPSPVKPTIRQPFIFLKIDNKWVKVLLADINYLESFGEYVKIHTESALLLTFSSLQKMEEMLPDASFYRTHRTFIVNISKIDAIEGNMIRIQDKKLPISRQRKEQLFDIYISKKPS